MRPENSHTSPTDVAGWRILYVTHRLPYPPAGGAKVRAFYTIQRLARSNEVTVAAPVRNAEEISAAEALRGYGVGVETEYLTNGASSARMAFGLVRGRPLSEGFFSAPRLVGALSLKHRRTDYDLVVVHCSSVAAYVADWTGPLKVLDFVDMDSGKWQDYARVQRTVKNLAYRYEAWSLARLERRLARKFDLCITATPFEDESLHQIAGAVPSVVVPNGVDTAYFKAPAAGYDRNLICFLGRMDYLPNVMAVEGFCNDVWPQIRAQRPEATFRIIGAEPTRVVRALGAIPGVEVTGSVPDVRPLVRGAACTVAPLTIARGTQNKVLESMAMGVPVVASSLAARGVDARPATDLVVADSAQAVAQAVIRLMTDDVERTQLASAGRARVEKVHTWAQSLSLLESRLAALMGDRDHSALRKPRAVANTGASASDPLLPPS